MIIVGLILSLGATQANRFLDIDMNRGANRLGATIRYLYNKAATEGLYLRLVFDFEKQSYWVEATSDPYLLVDPSEGKNKKTKKKTEKEEEKKEDSKSVALQSKEAEFAQVHENLLKGQKFPNSVFLKDVFVEHHEGAVENGQVTIAFFPNGYVERAVINLRDEDDEVHYSLKTNPITGQVTIEQEYRRLEDD